MGHQQETMSIRPPVGHKGLFSTLNRDLFRSNMPLIALQLPLSKCKLALSKFKAMPQTLLNYPRLKSIVSSLSDDSSKKLLILHPSIQSTDMDKLPPALKDFTKENQGSLLKYTLELDYDYWTADQILASILPDHLDPPNSFETIGHIGIPS